MSEIKTLPAQVDELIAGGEKAKAKLLLGELWRTNPGPAQAGFVLARAERLERGLSPSACKLALIRSFTVEPMVAVLRAAAWVNGIAVTAHVGDFNAFAQEILNDKSALYQFAPDVVIFAVQTRDLAPELWKDASRLSAVDLTAAVERVAGSYRDWIEVFRRHSRAHLIIHNLELPLLPSQGILDGQKIDGQVFAIQEINRRLQSLAREHTGVFVLDYDGLVARHGRAAWRDERKWLTMRMPVSANCLLHLANEWLRFLHPLTGRICKTLVVDLDDTLWGGVVGEVGVAGIVSGSEFPGAAYQNFQRALLDLYQRGILLAICSKNNPSDALEALQKHPGLLVRPEHFAAMRINWTDKSQNLREIAKELNIGTDALAFVDDNPVERQRVRMELPEVTVIDLPADSMNYERVLRETPVFERLALSAEDKERGKIYVGQRQRSELQERCQSLEGFYYSLEQEVELLAVTPDSIARVSQLTQKTNQFNLTSRRYSEQEIADLLRQPDCEIITARVRDRFGDNGMVGVAIVKTVGEVCEIDTFLLSCRVIGRAVETVMLAHLIARAKNHGLTRMEGAFIPTAKNAPAKDFFAGHGFSESGKNGDGSLRWSLDAAAAKVSAPDWTKVISKLD